MDGLAKKLIKEATGFDFSKTTEFNDWDLNTKELRNGIVHGKKYNVTSEEAHKSYDSVLSAIELIETKTNWNIKS